MPEKCALEYKVIAFLEACEEQAFDLNDVQAVFIKHALLIGVTRHTA
jgi:hypothetical protein